MVVTSERLHLGLQVAFFCILLGSVCLVCIFPLGWFCCFISFLFFEPRTSPKTHHNNNVQHLGSNHDAFTHHCSRFHHTSSAHQQPPVAAEWHPFVHCPRVSTWVRRGAQEALGISRVTGPEANPKFLARETPGINSCTLLQVHAIVDFSLASLWPVCGEPISPHQPTKHQKLVTAPDPVRPGSASGTVRLSESPGSKTLRARRVSALRADLRGSASVGR